LATEARTDPPPPDAQQTALSPDGQVRAWINGDCLQVLRLSDRVQQKDERDAQTVWHRRQAIGSAAGRQWFAAAFHLNHLLRADPDNPEVLGRRGDVFAEQGQWLPAAADFAAAADRQRDNAWHHFKHVLALLAAGDHRGYRQTCARMLKNLGEKP